MKYHRQCKLSKGKTKTVSWIPEEFAKKDKILKLKNNGAWEDGWTVYEVGMKLPTIFVMDRSQDYKHMKKRTDI